MKNRKFEKFENTEVRNLSAIKAGKKHPTGTPKDPDVCWFHIFGFHFITRGKHQVQEKPSLGLLPVGNEPSSESPFD